MNLTKVVLLSLLFVAPSYADELSKTSEPEIVKPHVEQPKFTVKTNQHATRNFVIEVSALGASKSLDFWTTTHALDRGAWEEDKLFGKRPSDKRLVFENLGIFAVQAGFLWASEHSNWKPMRWTGRALAGYWTQNHIRLAVGNTSVCGSQTVGQQEQICRYWAKQRR